MKVALMASEVAPFSKTGGLAEVAGALPRIWTRQKVDVTIFTPLYKSVREGRFKLESMDLTLPITLGERQVIGHVYRSTVPGTKIPVYFIEQEEFFDRDGLYGRPDGDFRDNALRYIFFNRAAIETMRVLNEPPDIVHAHDWQTALVPIYLKTLYNTDFPNVRSVLTIHNLAYQGLFWHWDMKVTGLDWGHFNWLEMEFYGKLNFLKAGIVHADALTTVSPTYAKEIQTSEYGCGLEGAIRERGDELHGILNGVEYNLWNPEKDSYLAENYSAKNLGAKEKCKAALQKELGLSVRKESIVMGMVGRLADQKGIDLLLPAIETLVAEGVQFALLGEGEMKYQEALKVLAKKYPQQVAINVAFDEGLAHRIEAGADMFLMPSEFEPCGLNQIYSMRYGTVPVVRSTGGLIDTVSDGKTGFVFEEYTAEAFLGCLRRAMKAYGEPRTWKKIMREGMKQDFSWDKSAKAYLKLFHKVRTQPVSV